MSFADIFVTEEYTDGAEDLTDVELQPPHVEATDKVEEPRTCPEIDESLETINETENSTEMTLKQGEPEDQPGDQFAVDGLLVNPDDLLPPVVKLEKYVDSDITFNRQVVVRNLLETLRAVQGNQGHVARVINVLCTLSDDYDPVVRSELMGQFPYIVSFCNENGLNSTVEAYLLPILVSYLGAENNQVRKAAHSALLTIVERKEIDFETVTEKICRLVVHLTDSIHPEDLRTDSVQLMSKLAVLIGKKITEDLFLQRFFSLCEDKANYVRKACASTFGDICTTVGRDTTEDQLLPKFIELCKDSAWGVRKACAENFMAVSSIVSRETRCSELTDIYLVLLKDQSRWVRVTAYQCLGPFISTFAEPCKTGLYYREGKLVICDVPKFQTTHCRHHACENLKNFESSSDRDRPNISEPCDSIVPLSCSERSLSASEIPGIPCHVGNYSTVIEVSCQNTTVSAANDSVIDDAISVPPIENGSQSLSQTDSNSVTKCSIDWCERQNMVNHFIYSKELNNSEDSTRQADVNVWYEFFLKKQRSLMNGDCSEIKESDTTDFEKIQKMVPTQNSVTVNGVRINTAEVLSESLNCETLPVVNFVINRSKQFNHENGNDSSKTEDTYFSSEHTLSENKEISISVHTPGAVLDSISEISEFNVSTDKNIIGKVSLDDESAFNHFQYWRTPIPDIDVDSLCNETSNCHDKCNKKSRTSIQDQKNQTPVNYTDIKPNSSEKQNCIEMKSEGFNRTSENKEGEPPPGLNITAYDQDIVPPELLKCYLNMIDTAWNEIAHHCAYSLPAVAITLGRKFWPCLKETFDALSSDLQGFIMMWKVRRTVASSMHQLAVILGPEITSKDLLPVFSRFIRDLDEVRIGILQHMSEFLKELLPEERKQFLPSLSEFLVSNSDTESKEKNWRFRLILAEQLVSVADLYEPEDVKEHLVPLSLTLIQDKICEVRLAAVRVMASVMKRMSQHTTRTLTKEVLSELTEKFIHSPKWFHRQLYVYICQEFIVQNSLPPDQFAEDALPQLLYLCWDRVPNVRIAIARCLAAVIWPLETFSSPDSPHRELLLQTLHTLQSDLDVDVQFYANMVSTHECSCLQHGEFTNLGELPV